MAKQKKVIVWGIVILVVLILAILGWRFIWGGKSNYYAVYLRTGDLYFGRLARFSRYTLKDTHFLIFTQDEQNPVDIQRFQDAFWGPGSKLKCNPENVVWISKLAPTSPIVSYIESQGGPSIAFPSGLQPNLPPTTSPIVPPQGTTTD